MYTPRVRLADDKAFRFHETFKVSGLPSYTSASRARSTPKRVDPSSKVCEQRLKELKVAYKALEQRALALAQANTELQEELETMKAINKQLLSERRELSPGDSHHMVQQLLITEAHNQVHDAQQEIRKLREEAERQRTRAGTKLEDNRKLQSTLNRYRKLLGESLHARRLHSSMQPRDIVKYVQTPTSTALPKLHSAKANTPKLLAYLNNLLLETNLRTVLTHVVTACKTVLNCKECTVFIVCPTLQQTYAACFDNHQQPVRLLLGRSWALLHSDIDCGEPVFGKPEEVSRGQIGDNYLVFPVTVKKQAVMIVQCTQVQGSIEHIAEVQLKVIIAGIQFALAHIAGCQNQQSLKQCIRQTASTMNIIAKCKNHCELSNTVHTEFPSLLGFEAASLVFVDEAAQDFFVNAVAAGGDERYCYDILRYPTTLGVASTALRAGGVKVFEDIKRLTAYSADVDNLAGVRLINSCVFACLSGPTGTVGVLVLTNKKSGGMTADDHAIIDSVRKVLGAFVSGINYTIEAMELTVRTKDTVESVVAKARAQAGPASEYTKNLSDQLHLVMAKLGIWENRRGQELSTIAQDEAK